VVFAYTYLSMATWTSEELKAKAVESSESFDNAGILLRDDEDLTEVTLCLLVPEPCVAWLIGKSGANINEIKGLTDAQLSFAKKESSARGLRKCVAAGTVASVIKATLIITSLLHQHQGACAIGIVVSKQAAGAVIGKSGGNLKLLREQYGCRVAMEKQEESTPMFGGRCLNLSHADSSLAVTQAIYSIIRIKGFASPSTREMNNPAPMDAMMGMGGNFDQSMGAGFDQNQMMGMDMFGMGGYGAMPAGGRQQPRFSPYGGQRDPAVCCTHNKRRGKQNLQPSMSVPGGFECTAEDRCKGSGGSAVQEQMYSPNNMAVGGQSWGGGSPQQLGLVCALHGKKRGQRNLTAHQTIPNAFVCLDADPCK
jgi:transcription antitermination factor NusA-like protein